MSSTNEQEITSENYTNVDSHHSKNADTKSIDKSADLLQTKSIAKSADQLHTKSIDKSADILQTKTIAKSADELHTKSIDKSADMLQTKSIAKSADQLPTKSIAKSADELHTKSIDKSADILQTKSIAKSADQLPTKSIAKSADELHTKSIDKSADEPKGIDKSADVLQTKSIAKSADEPKSIAKSADELHTKSIEKSADILQTKSIAKSADELQTKSIVKSADEPKSADELHTKSIDKSADILQTKSIAKSADELQTKSIAKSADEPKSIDKSADEVHTKSIDRSEDKLHPKSIDKSEGAFHTESIDKSADINQSKTIETYQTKSIDIHQTTSSDTDQAKRPDTDQVKSSDTLQTADDIPQSKNAEGVFDRKRVAEQKKVCIIGSGNWGTVIAKIIGTNITKLETFSDEVALYVQEEILDGKNLSDIINETHENIKYLPGHQLPENVIAISDVVEAAKEAHILVFTLQQEYILSVCTALVGKIKPTAAALCLTKGFELTEDGNIDLFSQIITRHLKIQTSVLMGANLYEEIANELYCEATIGCKDKLLAATLKELIQTEQLRVAVVDDVDAVEVCGSLRNVVACGVGFVDGLDMGQSAKATVVRLGLLEMIKFVDLFYPGSKVSTFFESCGVADLATCFLAGRNRQISEQFVSTKKSITDFENELLGGHTLEGPRTAKKLHFMIRERDMEDRFPLFTAVYKVYAGELDPLLFLDNVHSNPEHINVRLHHLTW